MHHRYHRHHRLHHLHHHHHHHNDHQHHHHHHLHYHHHYHHHQHHQHLFLTPCSVCRANGDHPCAPFTFSIGAQLDFSSLRSWDINPSGFKGKTLCLKTNWKINLSSVGSLIRCLFFLMLTGYLRPSHVFISSQVLSMTWVPMSTFFPGFTKTFCWWHTLSKGRFSDLAADLHATFPSAKTIVRNLIC